MSESLFHPEDLSRSEIEERQWSQLSEMLDESPDCNRSLERDMRESEAWVARRVD